MLCFPSVELYNFFRAIFSVTRSDSLTFDMNTVLKFVSLEVQPRLTVALLACHFAPMVKREPMWDLDGLQMLKRKMEVEM